MGEVRTLPLDPDQRRKLFEDALYDAAWLWWYGRHKEARDLLYKITLRAVPERIRVKAQQGANDGKAKESKVEHERGA